MLFYFLDLAQAVVDAGAVPLLVLCMQEPEIALKRIAASALSDIAKHSPEVGQYNGYVCCVGVGYRFEFTKLGLEL